MSYKINITLQARIEKVPSHEKCKRSTSEDFYYKTEKVTNTFLQPIWNCVQKTH